MIYPKATAPASQEALRAANFRAERWKSRCMAERAENERLRLMLGELGFCPKDGEAMPCLTCGAGL